MNQISFKNKPQNNAPEEKINEKRKEFVSLVEKYISGNKLFNNKDVSVTFAHQGISSLVSILEIDSHKVVLKFPLQYDHSFGEADFLLKWAQVGVSVPEVIDSGDVDGNPYILMKYIEERTVSDVFNKDEMVEKEVYRQMGETLRKMHEPKIKGYGFWIKGKAEYETFSEWVSEKGLQDKIKYSKENSLLDESHGDIEKTIERLVKFMSQFDESSYCHNDFHFKNLFATEPLTVFDPVPRINNQYLDLAMTIVFALAYDGGDEAVGQLIGGYFEGEEYSQEALRDAIHLTAYLKFRYWHQQKYLDRIEVIQKYLLEN